MIKSIDDILHKDAGCGSALAYEEQTSRVLFLKYWDDVEKDQVPALNVQVRRVSFRNYTGKQEMKAIDEKSEDILATIKAMM